MKRLLTFAVTALMGLGLAMADNMYIGGSIGVMHNSTTDKTTASILPEIGYNLDNHWGVGTEIGYSYVGDNGVRNHSFVLDPYVRYTFYRAGIVKLFVDGGIDFSLGATKYKGGGHTDASVTVGIGIKPGIAVDLNKDFSIVAHCGLLGYTYGNKAAKAGGRFTGGGLDLSNVLSFGLSYNF